MLVVVLVWEKDLMLLLVVQTTGVLSPSIKKVKSAQPVSITTGIVDCSHVQKQ